MEFFRWILILLGIVMLVATYFLGRRKVESIDYRRRIIDQDDFDPTIDDLSVPISSTAEDYADDVDVTSVPTTGYRDDEEFLSDEELDEVLPARRSAAVGHTTDDMGIDETSPPANRRSSPAAKVKSLANAVKQASQRKSNTATASMAEEFEVYDTQSDFEVEEKLVTLHITAKDRQFTGNELKLAFERHGYRFGNLSIYHCNYEKQKVFSVANMVNPGSFDLEKMSEFRSPGITLFMRLPVPLDADAAFDFLLREAQELSDELGGQLRDADRNTLTAQTIKHLREDIQQYSFRQKTLAQPDLASLH